MTDFEATVARLCETSRKQYVDPYRYLEWPERLEPDAWAFSPELVSVYGTPAWEGLSEAERKRLSFFETVNFFSLNIHGEKSLVEGLARRLYRSNSQVTTPYLHHFLDEENKHMVYFGGFCSRYAGKVYRDRKVVFPREYAPGEEDFLFFAKVLIFEEIVDVYNVRQAADERLPGIVRQINRIHHLEEARHLGFGRLQVERLYAEHAPGWSAATLEGLRAYLQGYLAATWREYYNPDVYRDAGLADPLGTQQAVYEHPRCRGHRAEVLGERLRFFRAEGLLKEVA